MVIIHNDNIKDLFYMNLLYELHKAEDRIALMKTKYKMSFEEFENLINSEKTENYTEWDDYMEWKAYDKSYRELISEKEDIINGNYQIS